MTTRSLLSAFLLGISTFAIVPAVTVRAEDAAAPEIENSKFQAVGQINSNAVYIRSGPSENDYPTLKLDRGGQVTAVGIRGDWLKIVPPQGSYCYVAKAYVEKRGDGTVGRVTNPLNVRVGSSLNAMKTKVAAKLDNGDDVQIVGEQDEYFKISPPKDVYLYVNKQFVELVSTAKAGATPAPAPTNTTQTPAPAPTDTQAGNIQTPTQSQTPAPTNDQTATPTPPVASNNTTPAPTDLTQALAPTDESAKAPTAQTSDSDQASAAPTTKPADTEADAENQFDQLEKTFIDNDKKTIDQQPLTELQAGYQKLTANPALPESLHRMCDYRLATLKERVEDQQRYLAVKKSQDDMKAKQLALQAEREELETRIKNSGIKYYTAVGTLRVSSLQQGGGTLYRLTDPKTGRTVIYIRTDDAKIGSEIGQFIGIQGSVTDEQTLNLKVITPTSFEEVDQSKLNVSIAAQIVPPSMMPTGTASTGNE